MKIVLVTGSSRSLGKSIIEKFAYEGFNVIINYNTSKEKAFCLKNYIEKSYKIKAYVYKCDVSNEPKLKGMFNKIQKDIGKIDVIINNAGICKDNNITDKNANEFMSVIKNNLLSTYLVCKYAHLIMDSGAIVNISSNNIYNGSYIESVDYDASKAGIVSLTHNFAKYYAPNIRVNTLAPGWINTDMTKNMDETYKHLEENKILLNRFANKKEIADAVYFLANNTYVNGTILRIDGGLK